MAQPQTEQIVLIPNELLKLVPLFDGDKRQLNLYLRKSQYIINKYQGSPAQNVYLMHALTSRLTGNAAALISEREDIESWSLLQELLIQHFGDPRSEECIAIELESMKIANNESYLDFCNRIQSVRSVLISKVNRVTDKKIKQSKITIYNNTSLNVFLYNLPENMVRIVRLKAPKILEDALSIVMEEVNFHEQYSLRNKLNNKPMMTHTPNTNTGFRFGIPNSAPIQPTGFKPNLVPQKFNFGVQQNQQRHTMPMFNAQGQNFGFRPPQPTGYRPPQPMGYRPPQPMGYRPQFGSTPQYTMHPQQFGMRPQQFGNASPHFGYRQQQEKPQVNQNNDVSMRTAAPLKNQQGFKLNEIELDQYQSEYYNPYDYQYGFDEGTCDYSEMQFPADDVTALNVEANSEPNDTNSENVENFYIQSLNLEAK